MRWPESARSVTAANAIPAAGRSISVGDPDFLLKDIANRCTDLDKSLLRLTVKPCFSQA